MMQQENHCCHWWNYDVWFHHFHHRMGSIHQNMENLGYLVAVVCCDKVYTIGGCGSDYNENNTVLDTVESIQVSSLVEMTETMMMTRQNNSQWTRLQC